MSLRAGLLNELITIRRATITKNDYGEEVETWEDVITTRARVTQTGSSKNNVNQEIFMGFTKEFQVRYYIDIREFDIIVWKQKQYRIVSLNQDRMNQYTTIIGELIND